MRTFLQLFALGLTAFFTLATSVETPCQTDAQCYSGEQCHPDGYCVSAPGPAACGDAHCGAREYCCNESCGLCAPQGASCTAQVCEARELRESEPLESTLPVLPLPGAASFSIQTPDPLEPPGQPPAGTP